jgi:hypothetical protein
MMTKKEVEDNNVSFAVLAQKVEIKIIHEVQVPSTAAVRCFQLSSLR